jgi:TonB-dependent outer membrane receptor, SusC/RagA subfamily, signature region
VYRSSNSGQAGADPEIRIRGTNSINGYKPLYVVDGLFNDNINFLNPEDIESMEVLKDPSSLAIFGVRGANGVIIVTTKRAKEGQTLVNIKTSFGWKSVVDKINMVNAPQFKELYYEQIGKPGKCPVRLQQLECEYGLARRDLPDGIHYQTTMSESQVLLQNIASISRWVTLTNRDTST